MHASNYHAPSDNGAIRSTALQRSISTRVTGAIARRIQNAPPVAPADKARLAAAVEAMPTLDQAGDR